MLQLTKILSWGKKESSREKLTKYMAGAHVPCLSPAGRVTPLAQLTYARDSGFTPGLSQRGFDSTSARELSRHVLLGKQYQPEVSIILLK